MSIILQITMEIPDDSPYCEHGVQVSHEGRQFVSKALSGILDATEIDFEIISNENDPIGDLLQDHRGSQRVIAAVLHQNKENRDQAIADAAGLTLERARELGL